MLLCPPEAVERQRAAPLRGRMPPGVGAFPHRFPLALPHRTLVIITRMTGYEEEDIRKYLTNGFEALIWDWGYFALILGH